MDGDCTHEGGSVEILHEAADLLRDLYENNLDSIRVTRLVVGVFFTGIQLSNGCGGVAYTPPETIQRASTRILKERLPVVRGMQVSEIIDGHLPGPFANVIRLATLNALSVPFFEPGRYVIGDGSDLTDFPQLFAGKRVCMVGAIIPLLKRLGELGVEDIAIVNKKKETQAEANLGRFVPVEKTAEALACCETAIFTGATIANGTLEYLLSCVPANAAIAVVGPTAGFVPEPLFRRRVTLVGTVVVTDGNKALDILSEGGGGYQLFGSCVRKINLMHKK